MTNCAQKKSSPPPNNMCVASSIRFFGLFDVVIDDNLPERAISHMPKTRLTRYEKYVKNTQHHKRRKESEKECRETTNLLRDTFLCASEVIHAEYSLDVMHIHTLKKKRQ